MNSIGNVGKKTLISLTIPIFLKLLLQGNIKEGGFKLLQVYRGLPKNKHLIKFLSEDGNRVLLQKTCSQHKQDVAADVVKGIENIFAEHGNVFPRTIAQNGRNIAEDEDSSQHNRNRGGTADFGFFLNGRNQHFINGQRSR